MRWLSKAIGTAKGHHDFVLGERLVEEDIPDQWYRVTAECRTCGERRKVYHGVPIHNLNKGQCPRTRRSPRPLP